MLSCTTTFKTQSLNHGSMLSLHRAYAAAVSIYTVRWCVCDALQLHHQPLVGDSFLYGTVLSFFSIGMSFFSSSVLQTMVTGTHAELNIYGLKFMNHVKQFVGHLTQTSQFAVWLHFQW